MRRSIIYFLGVHTLGMRLRHEVFDAWIDEKKSMRFVLEHLEQANFDPEFYKRHEKEIRARAGSE